MKSSDDSAAKNLTVVIPSLNSALTLDWTLASLSAAKELRVIVADSFSTDDTLGICARWGVETISVPAGNMYAAINAGLKTARTAWLAYVNSDDWVFTGPYLEMLHKAIRSSADIAYGSADYVDQSGRFLFSFKAAPEKAAVRILRSGHMPFAQPAAIFSRSAYESLGGFDERYRAAADYDFFCRAALSNRVFRRLESQPVAAFRLHGTQLTVQKPHLDQTEKMEIRERLDTGKSFLDRSAFFAWRCSNSPEYAGRIFRTFGLSGSFRLKRSHMPQSYGHGSDGSESI